jgi:Leucine-rich repeat (LRR) protein
MIPFAAEPRQLQLQIHDVGLVSSIDLTVCTWLQRLFIMECFIEQLPPSITLLTDLVEIDLRDNRLTSIDEIDFVCMSKLTSLSVSNVARVLCRVLKKINYFQCV